MNIFLSILLVILTVYGLGYFILVTLSEEEDVLTFYEKLEEKVLAMLVKDSEGKLLKNIIMKKLHISYFQLKSCIKQLIDQELIISSEYSIELTTLGRIYYNTFLKNRT